MTDNAFESVKIPVKNPDNEVVGYGIVYDTGQIEIMTDDEGAQLFEMLREGLADSLTIRANQVSAHPMAGVVPDDIFKPLTIPVPRIAPSGFEISKSDLKNAWEAIIKPMQDAEVPMSMEWRVVMATLRAVYGAMPEDN